MCPLRLPPAPNLQCRLGLHCHFYGNRMHRTQHQDCWERFLEVFSTGHFCYYVSQSRFKTSNRQSSAITISQLSLEVRIHFLSFRDRAANKKPLKLPGTSILSGPQCSSMDDCHPTIITGCFPDNVLLLQAIWGSDASQRLFHLSGKMIYGCHFVSVFFIIFFFFRPSKILCGSSKVPTNHFLFEQAATRVLILDTATAAGRGIHPLWGPHSHLRIY